MNQRQTSKLLSERQGPVTTVTINRPDVRTALDSEAARALRDAFVQFDAGGEARAAVLTGTDGAFCASAGRHGSFAD
jgi:enoyl-CoA hydratase